MSVGLTQLLPQALRQRRHCKLSGAVEVGVGAVDDAVSTHAAGGSRRGSKTLSLAGPFYPLTCRGDYKTPPVYVNDVTVVDIPLLHRLISLTCADAQCENVDLGEEPAKRGQGGLTPFYDVRGVKALRFQFLRPTCFSSRWFCRSAANPGEPSRRC